MQNIHSALEYAVDIELLIANPADRVKRPKKEKYIGDIPIITFKMLAP